MKILPGKEIFQLVDSHGLPLDIILLELSDKNCAFDTSAFIVAARDAGWNQKRVFNMLRYAGSQANNYEFIQTLKLFIAFHYETSNNQS